MRGALRITWLLLSLSFLLHNVCSNNQSDTSVSKGATTTTAGPTGAPTDASTVSKSAVGVTDNKQMAPTATTTLKVDVSEKLTQAATPSKPGGTVTLSATTVNASSTPTVGIVPTKQQAPATNKPTAPLITTVSVTTQAAVVATSAATTGSRPKDVTPAPTAANNGVLVSANAAKVQTSAPTAPIQTTGAPGTPVNLPGVTTTVGTTNIQKVSSAAPTPGQQSTAHTTVPSSLNQKDSKEEKTAVTNESPVQNVSGASKPTENTGTTNSPTTLSKADPPALQSSTKAGTASLQTSTTSSLTTRSPSTTSSPITTPSPSTTSSPRTTPSPSTIPSSRTTPRPTTTPSPSTSASPGSTATAAAAAAATASTTTTASTSTTLIVTQPKTFLYSLNNRYEKEEEKDLVEVCRRLMANLHDGNCTLVWQHRNGNIQFDNVEINGKVKTSLANEYYNEITKKPTDNKTLIAILASCGALLIMIVILAVCASHHRKPYGENQQHLTEELHTVENGYHDNPTLEVMEVQPEMQEKKMALNGEFNDSWIVPIDNLMKGDLPDEEDTHL